MDMDRELERLRQVYAGQSDAELLRLDAGRDELTDAAQDALASVMKERKLGTPSAFGASVVGAGAAAVDLPPGDEAALAGEVVLYSFDDMFQANNAVALLDEAGMAYRLVDRSYRQAARGPRGSTPRNWLQLVVKEDDFEAAKQLLHDEMGLFPGPEVDAPDAAAGSLDDLMGVQMFDSEAEMPQAVHAATALAKAGISFYWHDGRDSPEGLADDKTIAIEVRQASVERAGAVIDAALEGMAR